MTFDKTKVVPPEYARVLDSNIKFHFLDEAGTILHTIDDSDFNIIISNTQKIIVKKKRKESTPTETLFAVPDHCFLPYTAQTTMTMMRGMTPR